jgi:hypothetical protein
MVLHFPSSRLWIPGSALRPRNDGLRAKYGAGPYVRTLHKLP